MSPRSWLAVFLSLVYFGVYFFTLCPTVGAGDSGELIAAAAARGIAHPPGYPLYTMLASLFTWLPWGSVAWKVNLFSAVGQAGAAGILTWSVARWSANLAAGALAGGLFAFSPLAWRYAITAEVFALNSVLAAVLLGLLVLHNDSPSKKYFFGAAFVAGLGVSHHHLLIFFSLPVLWCMRPKRARDYYWGASAFVLGLLPYLYLPWAAAHSPRIAWGDLSTMEGFLTHFFRREYGTFQLSPIGNSGPMDLPRRLSEYGIDLFRQTLFVGPGLAATAIIFRGKDRALRTTIVGVVAYLIVFHLLSNLDLDSQLDRGVQARFWIQPNLWVCAWIGLGAAQLWRWVPPAFQISRVIVPLFLVWAQALLHFHAENRRGHYAFRDYALTILAPLPENALLLIRGDLVWNTARYLQVVENYRPDLRLVHWNLLRAPWLRRQMDVLQPSVRIPGEVMDPLQKDGYSFQTFLEANQETGPIFVCDENPKSTDNPRFELGFTRWPWGFTEVLLEDSQKMNLDNWLRENERILSAFDPRWLENFAETEWEHVLAVFFLKSHLDVIERVMLEAEVSKKTKWLRETARLMESFLEKFGPYYPDLRPQLQKNLGFTWWKLASRDKISRAKAIASWREFLREAPPEYPEREKVANLLRGLGEKDIADASGISDAQPVSP